MSCSRHAKALTLPARSEQVKELHRRLSTVSFLEGPAAAPPAKPAPKPAPRPAAKPAAKLASPEPAPTPAAEPSNRDRTLEVPRSTMVQNLGLLQRMTGANR